MSVGILKLYRPTAVFLATIIGAINGLSVTLFGIYLPMNLSLPLGTFATAVCQGLTLWLMSSTNNKSSPPSH